MKMGWHFEAKYILWAHCTSAMFFEHNGAECELLVDAVTRCKLHICRPMDVLDAVSEKLWNL